MAVIVSQGESSTFAPAPEGLHQAVCVDVVDRGMVEGTWGVKHKLDVIWQVVPFDDDGREQHDDKDNRYQVLQRYTASLHPKSLLHQHLRAWRGKPFSDEELAGFDVEKLIGANCQLQIVHNIASNGRTYGNIQAIVPISKGMTKLKPIDYERIKERAKQNGQGGNGSGHDEEEDMPF